MLSLIERKLISHPRLYGEKRIHAFPRCTRVCIKRFHSWIRSFILSVSTGVSVTSSNTGVPDISGSVYTKTQVITYSRSLFLKTAGNWKRSRSFKTSFISLLPLQSFEKQGFHAGTPAASFSLPSALGSGGPINPPAAAGYAPAPFMHILAPHQQPHSQILHHHLQQDGQVRNYSPLYFN